MPGLWIRVAADLPDSRAVARCAEALRIHPMRAVGHLVALWIGAARDERQGIVGDIPDTQLEQWARWDGKRGALATWVRGHHVDESGRIKGWNEYQGKLEGRRKKDREKKRDQRSGVGEKSDGHRADVLPPPEGNGDGNVNKQPNPSSSSAAELRELLLASVPHRGAWQAEFAVVTAADPMPGHTHMTSEQLDEAIRDYVGNGHHTQPNLKHFRGFLRSAARPAEHRTRRERTNAGEQGFANALAGVGVEPE